LNIQDLGATVWKILSGMPIEVFDEENYSVWENDLWELVSPRSEGDFAGSRLIGSANMVTAFNIIHQKLLINQVRQQHTVDSTTRSLDLFKEILDYLQQQKLIRKKPHKVRKTFQIV
jgi:hypothetical protein